MSNLLWTATIGEETGQGRLSMRTIGSGLSRPQAISAITTFLSSRKGGDKTTILKHHPTRNYYATVTSRR